MRVEGLWNSPSVVECFAVAVASPDATVYVILSEQSESQSTQ